MDFLFAEITYRVWIGCLMISYWQIGRRNNFHQNLQLIRVALHVVGFRRRGLHLGTAKSF